MRELNSLRWGWPLAELVQAARADTGRVTRDAQDSVPANQRRHTAIAQHAGHWGGPGLAVELEAYVVWEQCIRSSSCPPPRALLSHVLVLSLKWAYVVYATFGDSGKQTRRRYPRERKVSGPKSSQGGREQTYYVRSMTLGAAITGQSPRGSSLTVEWRIFNGARVGTDPILFQCPWQCKDGMYLYMAFPGWFAPSIPLWARP